MAAGKSNGNTGHPAEASGLDKAGGSLARWCKRITRQDLIIAAGQAGAWLTLLLIPFMIEFFSHFNWASSWKVLLVCARMDLPLMIFFSVNFYVLIPRLLYRNRPLAFTLVDFLLYVCLNIWLLPPLFSPSRVIPEEWGTGIYLAAFGLFFLDSLVVFCAIGIRYIMRLSRVELELKEERQKNAEAELAWLKSQLNPHFLFNTLNNIASLVQIDADMAQDSIGRLSDLLRYTLYDSNLERVPLEGEISFMDNYIQLMKLRCGEKVVVESDLRVPPKPVMIAPLLFITLIENAFKHGVNNRKDSFVRIRFGAEGSDLVFTCENSDYPKKEENRIGSGIGLENLRRRLELLYPGRYSYQQELRGDTYFARIILRKCL